MSTAKKQPASERRVKVAESVVSYDRHCDEIGTYNDALAAALAPRADADDAPGLLTEALEQLSTDLFMLGALLGGPQDGPINPEILHRAVGGIRGRADALKLFVEHKVVVRWRYSDDNEAEFAEKAGLKSEVRT